MKRRADVNLTFYVRFSLQLLLIGEVSVPPDASLLRDFANHRSEKAFAELVSRHLDLVHSTALRMTGDRHLAEDVSENFGFPRNRSGVLW
jgi:hypothetical protein